LTYTVSFNALAGMIHCEYFHELYTAKESVDYLPVKTTLSYVRSFWHNTVVWQTDRQTDRIAVAKIALSM